MNKKEFIEYFSLEDKNSMSHIFEKYELTNYGLKGITGMIYHALADFPEINLDKANRDTE